ncbi:hypothetical protein DICPUDRAFT_156286 [Dictyostelium purpureum]|uniref:Enoyl reductase (ER) domain-containing protein n=1 Tax=Dictyostelium purpureum TaxID=5786 RepID=F0ZW71_DICPU|nr:uncharacterized protein DICPUDRAFT_156286 [Dictyostelium purpureum]EGC31798.1 hypothetical protein DICPUDRAFT_156286 [Dictyostelium purpureum]|eukprot:XP_003291665.1 hypothetical protein DICPUDRAFT_156286 [Dictyostelium purpureum]
MSMKAAVFKEKNGQLEIVEKPIPEPAKGWVRIKVISCGVCHSDFAIQHGNPFPRTPGHEVVGVIDKIGEGVESNKFSLGKLGAVGWFGGHCGSCPSCLENEWAHCEKGKVCGIHYDGGYAEYMTCPEDALVFVPEGMDPIESAPLLCAGITVYNSFRNLNIKSGSLVGVQGIGGLGHLGIQFCHKMGYEVIAMSGGSSKKELAKKLGAAHYVDMSKDYIDEMKKIGSVKCILVTAPNAQNIQGMLESLGVNGKLVMLALLPEPFNANAGTLIGGNKSIVGWASGDSRDSADTLHFAKMNGVKPMVKSFPLEQAREALEKISDARFRHVIEFKK